METILKLHQLRAGYGDKEILHGVSMEVENRGITAIIGPSGCGKSTLLACINRTLEENTDGWQKGDILLDGADIRKMDEDELRRRVGLVFQTPAPFPFSIYRNMTYAPRYYGIHDRQRLEQICREKLTMAGLYDEVCHELKKNALQLSGGQQQRLCIARALTVEPEILLLDEPCSALDVQSTAAVEKLLLELKKEYTIMIVTHNLPQARRIADRVAFLYQGELVEYGSREEMFEHPQQEQTRAFLGGIYG